MSNYQGISSREFPIKKAYSFGIDHGISKETLKIKDMQIIKWNRQFTTRVRYGYMIELFSKKGLLKEFEVTQWPNGLKDGGEKLKKWYLDIKERYEKFMSQTDTLQPE
jgi:hypothetical protein